jgi:glycosyl transferase family 2
VTTLITATTATYTEAITMTVVVPSVNGFADLEPTLTALAAEASDVSLEIIVVDRCGEAVRNLIRRRFPQVRVIDAPPMTTIPGMRSLGFDAARGAAVAVIEDHVIVPHGWARAMIDAQRESPVVGGTVENAATTGIVDWAAFLCEYSQCLSPLPAGPSEWLTGNNVVYRRTVLEQYRSRLSPNEWENHLHGMMRADGVVLMCRPDICVRHLKHVTVGEYLQQRYLYARSYAGARVAGSGVGRRALMGAAAVALPPVLFYRIVSTILRKRRHRAELLRGLPLIAMFVCAWAAGEVIGSWFGAGDSLRKVR